MAKSPHNYIMHLTVGELEDIIRSIVHQEQAKHDTPSPTYARGIKGLAKTLNVSYSRAFQIKSSGILDKAIHQDQRTILIDTQLAQELYIQHCQKIKKSY